MNSHAISSATIESANAYRPRLLEGMAHSVAAKGYADTTVADIVREAGVSKRTFYECFATKADCLIALYEAASHNALKMLGEAIDPAHEWQTQIERALAAYLGCMMQNPVLMRTLFIEILGLGAQGLAARRRVNLEIAGFMLGVINRGQGSARREPPLSAGMAMAIVGGINELILEYIEQDKVAALNDLVLPASQLVRAVTHAHADSGDGGR
ncbi:TetR/AcrR family transcriptional regulator [Polaromonas eurypsychrophila]|uniref:TetR family transcriptional regulator n=1 Tax=Polaromonas eurypsychrophila TaxID=1614635 RepID=A0A916WGV0_9BURK|nr:TetR/AcrR family transcriptional regulator [Polaromonas eurypsychrophila]GGA99930.1 TetR family transcriptional regulator [Polaromonas eurypsychrophila]